jgi:predicted aminopeptidase
MRNFPTLLTFAMGIGSLSIPLAGCSGVPYVLHVAEGQFTITGDVEPIADVLASGRLSDDDATKLELIVAARQFAIDHIGLDAGASYTTFYDTNGDPLAFNLSAARQDALVPRTWTFPFVGEVPYLAFFDEAYLRRVEEDLQDAGYDTLTYELDAYSTLGLFADPVRSTMLRRGVLSLSDTIIHELLHNTIYRSNATDFNESLATFVGRTGAVQFLQARYGADSGWADLAAALYADVDTTNVFQLELYEDLRAFYAQPLSRAEKVSGREAVFEAARQRFVADVQPTLNYPDSFDYLATLPSNNAWVLANKRYNLDLELFAQVFAANAEDWRATLDVFRAAAAHRDDPFQYLRDWLANVE